MTKQTDRDKAIIGHAIKDQIKEKNNILEVLKELYLCRTTAFTEEQAQRKLQAQFEAEELLKKYGLLD